MNEEYQQNNEQENQWNNFLDEIAEELILDVEQKDFFLKRFCLTNIEKDNSFNKGRHDGSSKTWERRLSDFYQKLLQKTPHDNKERDIIESLNKKNKGRLPIFKSWLKFRFKKRIDIQQSEFSEQPITEQVNSEVKGESEIIKNLNEPKEAVNNDEILVPLILDKLKKNAPQFVGLFNKAITDANQALKIAKKADDIARYTQNVFAEEIKNQFSLIEEAEEYGQIDTFVLTSEEKELPSQMGNVGIIIYGSGDIYSGQFVGKISHGLGVCKIYTITKKFTPNRINFFRGEWSYSQMGEYGLYEFESSSTFAGKWIDNHPHCGILRSVCREYDIYFGNMGDITELGTGQIGRSWEPNGLGIGIKLLKKQIICGTFFGGKASEDIYIFNFE
jgi:hypothetical protein